MKGNSDKMTKIFEILMLLSFGFAWPFSIVKSIKSKSTAGKSLFFLAIILFGYVCGITNRVINGANYVLIFYILNLIMVSIDIGLYLRNKALIKKKQS